jgi:AAA ATPase domain
MTGPFNGGAYDEGAPAKAPERAPVKENAIDVAALIGPARELVLAAAVSERFRPSELVRDWLDRNGDSQSSDLEEVVDVALSLGAIGGEDAERKEGAELPLALRRDILAHSNPTEMLAALGKTARTTATEFQFSNLLSGQVPELDHMSRGDLQAFATAASWSDGLAGVAQIDPSLVRQRISDQEFVERVGGTDLHHFVGRSELLKALSHIWKTKKRPIVLIEGPGGIGKSLAVARFFQILLREDDGSARPDAILHLDFDLPWLQHATEFDMTIEILRQLAERWKSISGEGLRYLLRRLGGSSGLNRSTRHDSSKEYESRDYRRKISIVDVFDEAINRFAINRNRRPKVILFADSFERAQSLDEVAALNVSRVAEALGSTGADLMVIYAARTFINPSYLGGRSRVSRQSVTRFTQGEAVDYLTSKGRQRGIKLTRELAGRANRDLMGWPLGLRIAVSLLGNDSQSFDAGDWLQQIEGGGRTVQATLYERLLDRIRDEDLRRLAKPGLLVRRISAEVIERVLAKPCGLSSGANPRNLMAKAEEEGQLFWRDSSDGGALWHRQDLREIMLPILRRDVSAVLTREIHDAAVDYYSEQGDDVSRAEELYHRLCRGDTRDQISLRWRTSAGQRLVGAIDELPLDGAAMVRLLLGGGRSEAAFELDELRGVAQNRLSESLTDLSDIFDRAEVESGLFSPLGDVFAQSLLEQRRLDELLNGAERILGAQGVPEAVKARIMITAATAAEGLLDLDRALTFRRFAYRRSKLLNEVEQFSLRIALARLVRKNGRGNRGRHAHVLAACDLLAHQARQKHSMFSSSPVLRLEAVAELSEVLQPFRHWHERANSMAGRELVRFFRDLSPMFPSTLDNEARLRELATVFDIEQGRVQTEQELSSLMFSYFDNADPQSHAKALTALRSEVDASFEVVVGTREPQSSNPSAPPQVMA